MNNVDGDHIAAILTDGMNNEIQCNVGHLQTSSEVTTGHGHLMGLVLTIFSHPFFFNFLFPLLHFFSN